MNHKTTRRTRAAAFAVVAAMACGAGVSANAGTLDLTNNAMILRAADSTAQASNVAQVMALVASGYNGGAWDGAGINSSVATNDAYNGNACLGISILDNSLWGNVSFAGVGNLDQPDGLYDQVLIKVTFMGDLNQDGVVDGYDYLSLGDAAFNWNVMGTMTPGADLNFDGVIDGYDYLTIGNSAYFQDQYNADLTLKSAIQPAVAVASTGDAAPAPVPEPGAFGLLGVGAAALLSVRRKKAGV